MSNPKRIIIKWNDRALRWTISKLSPSLKATVDCGGLGAHCLNKHMQLSKYFPHYSFCFGWGQESSLDSNADFNLSNEVFDRKLIFFLHYSNTVPLGSFWSYYGWSYFMLSLFVIMNFKIVGLYIPSILDSLKCMPTLSCCQISIPSSVLKRT